ATSTTKATGGRAGSASALNGAPASARTPSAAQFLIWVAMQCSTVCARVGRWTDAWPWARKLAEGARQSSHAWLETKIVGPLCPRVFRRRTVKPAVWIGEENPVFAVKGWRRPEKRRS